MNYITTVEAAKKWGISPTRITILCKGGRVPGAKQIGSRWMIPERAVKPIDGRTKGGKNAEKDIFFRYPAFEGRNADDFYPPLCEEELQLKRALEAFYACRFEEAERELGDLAERSEDKCRRMVALRLSCTISIYLCRCERFLDCYGRLTAETEGEYPHKAELREMIHELDATLGENRYFAEEFRVEIGYSYHESYLAHLGALGAIALFLSEKSVTPELIQANEMICSLLDGSGHYTDIQSIHLYLGGSYAVSGKGEEATVHFRRALELAETYELYFGVAGQYYYMPKVFETALEDFSEEFKERLQRESESIHSRYIDFMSMLSVNSLFTALRHREYVYVLYAVQGYRNTEVAGFLHLSERTVNKKYNEIYQMLHVKNKRELKELYRRSVGVTEKKKTASRGKI